MNQKRLTVAATIIALIIIGGFLLSVPHTRDVAENREPVPQPPSMPAVSLRDVFKKGTHTISGSVTAPNACATVTTVATLRGDATSSQSILVDITMPPDRGICLQVPTPTPFQATLTAPAKLPITVTVNGVMATTTQP